MIRIAAPLQRDRGLRILVATVLLGISFGWLMVGSQGSRAELAGPGQSERRVTRSVASLVQRVHLARRAMDDEMSQRCLDNFLKALDSRKSIFLQSDIDEFMASRNELDDRILRGDISPAYTIFNRFLERVEERAKVVDELLDEEHDFTVDEQITTDPDVLQHPKNRGEARERSRKRVKYDLLLEKANEVDPKEAKAKLKRRNRSFAKRMNQTDNDDLLEMYLTAMTMAYDPHTSYMSKSTQENFLIELRLELDGIGASLKYEDGYTVVHKIIQAGAADKDGRLKVKDKIVAVGQGENAEGEMVDVVDMKLADVVKKIRGKRGTVVRLGVIPADDPQQQTYSITRARIELKDREARGEIVEEGTKPDGSPLKIGFIDLPSFYMDMDGARAGRPNFKSTTRDVRRILEDFKAKNVDVVMLDLRHNGGGSLTESRDLTGLFIESGPVVQVKGFDGRVDPLVDRDPEMVWTGPLVVLISKFSASASEIFAGAIQDYRRGLVIGDHSTHGKGTVQQLLDLGRQIFHGLPNAPRLGALKVTIQQFYRANGDSTQNRGVLSDVELPSLTTHLDIGESDLDFALKFDQVAAVRHLQYGQVDANLAQQLEELSAQRQSESEDFQKLAKNIARYKERKARKSVTLNEEKFLAEWAELNAEKEQEKLDEELNDPDRPVVKRDFYFNEAAAVTADYIRLLEQNQLTVKLGLSQRNP